jgi:hypothetical protein
MDPIPKRKTQNVRLNELPNPKNQKIRINQLSLSFLKNQVPFKSKYPNLPVVRKAMKTTVP